MLEAIFHVKIHKLENDPEFYVQNLIANGSGESIACPDELSDITLPYWYDEEKFEIGQQFYRKNKTAIMFSELIATITLLSVPSMLQIIVHSNTASTPETAYKRYVSTIHYLASFYENKLQQGTRSWKNLIKVRKQHFLISKKSEESEIGFINQKDVALSQFLFVGLVTIRSSMFGIQVDSKDCLDGFFHFWRVIGYILGVKDEYNLICNSVKRNVQRFDLILKEIIRPHLEESSILKDFYRMADSAVKGLSALNPMYDTDAIIYYAKMLTNCTDYDYFADDVNFANYDDYFETDSHKKPLHQLSYKSRFLLWTYITTYCYLLNFSAYRWIHNLFTSFVLWLNLKFPVLAISKFGKKKAYIKV